MTNSIVVDLFPQTKETGVEAYRKYVNQLHGLHSIQMLLDKAKEMNVPELTAKRFLESLLEKGDLNKAPAVRVNSDELGCFVETKGKKFYTHPLEVDQAISLAVLEGGGFEELDAKLFLDLINPGDTVIDIGANIGVWTWLLSEKVGPGVVWAFEPEPINFLVLQKNLVSCNMSNVRAFCTAVGNITGFCKLYLNPRNAGDHRVWTHTEKREVSLAQCISLDDWMLSDKIDAIKIDTQGAEQLILEGAKNLISIQSKLAMCVEFWPTGLKALGSCEKAFESLLRQYGFHDIYKIHDGKKEVLKPGCFPDLIDPYSYGFMNLLCLKGF